jgi:hypothetical protein
VCATARQSGGGALAFAREWVSGRSCVRRRYTKIWVDTQGARKNCGEFCDRCRAKSCRAVILSAAKDLSSAAGVASTRRRRGILHPLSRVQDDGQSIFLLALLRISRSVAGLGRPNRESRAHCWS